ncbi:MAG: hypothetical protein IBJ16_04830 [Chitinophagaceae bacterium]|nr:hypothetical protein [Chitinophagaceae bacterium]
MKKILDAAHPKTCLTCNHIIRGRTDKKFCDDYCRSAYNNKHTSKKLSYIRSITNKIIKNRSILEKWANKKRNPISLYDLLSDGLSLSYATEYINQPVGNPYVFCYEYGYQLLPGNNCRILKRKTTAETGIIHQNLIP